MAIPSSPIALPETMDPADLADYTLAFQLEGDSAIASYVLAPLPEAALLGISIVEAGAYAHGLIEDNRAILVWLQVDEPDREDPAFDGGGVTIGIAATVTTTSDPSRRKQRTFTVKVAQR